MRKEIKMNKKRLMKRIGITVAFLVLTAASIIAVCYFDGSDNIKGTHCVGYIEDAKTEYIKLYTEENGRFLGEIPWAVVEDYTANDRTDENYTFGYMNMDFYYGTKGAFIWAVACAKPTFSACTVNVCTSNNKGESWYVGTEHMRKGIVDNVWFVSENEGYISYSGGGNGSGTSKTVDGGITWTHTFDN